MTLPSTSERLRRWRLLLGAEVAEGIEVGLSQADLQLDAALGWLYDTGRSGGLQPSSPTVARWLGDIRNYFPSSVVRVMQKDALERLNLRQMLLEPEMLSAIEPDIHLVSTLLSLKNLLPAKSRETARIVVRKVVEDLEKRLASPLRQAVIGSLNRACRTRRPRHKEIDWNRTIRANLKHYQPEYKTVVPELRIGYGRRRNALRDVILCVDQSGSMAASVVHSGVFGAVLASIAAVRTKMVVFDTSVVDLSDVLSDPVEVLFGTQLGGGTDINRALGYCQTLVESPQDTILVLISDLYEGGNREEMLRRAADLAASGVQVIALLALSDQGAPAFDHNIAAAFTGFGIPAFACTPDLFPDFMAAAIARTSLSTWASEQGIAHT